MNEKITSKRLLRVASVIVAAAMFPCIIAFGLGASRAATTEDGAEVFTTEGETAANETNLEESVQEVPTREASSELEEETGAQEREESETMTDAEEEGSNEELVVYGDDGTAYTVTMYCQMTGENIVPNDWPERLKKLLDEVASEEESFSETDETDDGATQEEWQPEDGIDMSAFQESELSGDVAAAAVEAAKARLGYPYSQARRDSGSAYDCSSLVYWSYRNAGVDIDPINNHTAASIAQYMVKTGREISSGDLRPGDLIFYSYKKNGRYKNISHVAMVAENGQMIHASSSKKKVVLSTLSTKKAVVVARPVLEEDDSMTEDEDEEGGSTDPDEFLEDIVLESISSEEAESGDSSVVADVQETQEAQGIQETQIEQESSEASETADTSAQAETSGVLVTKSKARLDRIGPGVQATESAAKTEETSETAASGVQEPASS